MITPLAAAFALSAAAAPQTQASPVVGGSPADPGAWPDAAALFTQQAFACTGTLVAPDLVLTAGHCGFNVTEVVLGTVDHGSGGERLPVARVTAHPDYFTTFDVAVVELARPATTPHRLLALDCIERGWLVTGNEVAIVGYGATDSYAQQWGSVLNEARTVIRDASCADLASGCNATVSPGGELVAGGDGIDSCNGDSGGPLYLLTPEGAFLAGITSRAASPATVPCGDGGIYVRPDAVLDWVEDVTGRTLDRPQCEGVNLPPVPEVASVDVRAGSSVLIEVQSGDPDPDGHTLEVALGAAQGRTSAVSSSLVLYTADHDARGTDSFLVRVTDDGAPPLSGEAVVRVRVMQGTARPAGCSHTRHPASPLGILALLAVRRRK